MGIAVAIVAILATIAMASCAAKKGPEVEEPERPVIKEIVFEGVERFEKKEIISYLYMGETSWWAWTKLTDTYFYTKGFAEEDAENILRLYQAYGYYDAVVENIRTEPIDEDDPMKLRVIIEIEEGDPALVRNIRVLWPEGEVHKEAVEAQIKLKEGEAFEVKALNETQRNMSIVLHEFGYALSEVQETVEVDRLELVADITLTVKQGPFCRIGRIRYEGLADVPSGPIDVELDFVPDEAYSPQLLKKVQKVVYAMDVFDSVSVLPEKGLDAEGKLGILVQVIEGKPQRVKVGPGVGIEPNRWQGHATLKYTHKNIARSLVRLDMKLQAGYALLPYPWDIHEHGPVLKLTPSFSKKGWLEPKMKWRIEPEFELGIEEGYQFYTPRLRVGFSRWLWKFTLIDVSYNFEFYDFFNVSPLLDSSVTQLGRDFRDPYILSYLRFKYQLFFTDDFFVPRNGAIIGLTWDAAGTILGGHYDFHKLIPEVKVYWQVFSHLQVALRAETGFIFPYAWNPGAPISEKLYLGGSTTARGWGTKRLSPRVEECDPINTGDCSSIPVGGYTSLMANLELRFMVYKDVYVVPFVDMGDVQPGTVEYQPSQWSYSTGGGMRYASPFGTFRLDFGWRLNEVGDRFEGERRWGIHFGLGEMF